MKTKSANLEKDLKSSELIRQKCQDLSYAQNLYAALCNTDLQTFELWTILKDEVWNCSWRAAGRIIAEIRDCGEEYITWYCSGITPDYDLAPPTYDLDSSTILLQHPADVAFVAEGTVTDEIRLDLESIGWRVVNIERED